MPTVYLSLGSNMGDRQSYLKLAIEEISKSAGVIKKVSPVYQTKAWGFEGKDFLNMVLELETNYSPDKLLTFLKEIESKTGRKKRGQNYTDRYLDIDILAYENQIVEKKDLAIPHKFLHKRRFVLEPWNEIAPGFFVPGLDKTVSELLSLCEDKSPVIRMSEENLNNPFPFDFIVVEGNIGAGKTSLSKMISHEFNAQLIVERFEENPFLPKFYEDPKRYAFPLEMSFMADRYQQLNEELSERDLFSPFVISDYFVIKSLIFAGVTLEEEEYKLFRRIFNSMYKDLRKPDLYIYLYRTTDDLLKNIAKRGRDYEKNITSEYLKNIHEGYMKFIKSQSGLNVLFLDITGVDFIKDKGFYSAIKDIIKHTPKTPDFRRIKIEPNG